jgi:hypothetical protein
MRRHTSQFDEYEGEIESLDDIDIPSGFSIMALDTFEELDYGYTPDDTPPCDFGFGDKYGLCVRAEFGCSIEGCPFAEQNY